MSDDQWRRGEPDPEFDDDEFGAVRFSDDDNETGAIEWEPREPISFGEGDTGSLPHWTSPAGAEESPIAPLGPDDDLDVWSSFTAQDADEAAIVAAKVVAAWRKASGSALPAIKGGLLEGSVLDRETAQRLEKMPGRRELQARIAGQIVAPARRLASVLGAAGGALAGAIRARIEQLEQDAG